MKTHKYGSKSENNKKIKMFLHKYNINTIYINKQI